MSGAPKPDRLQNIRDIINCPSCKTHTEENQRLRSENAALREENAQLEKLLTQCMEILTEVSPEAAVILSKPLEALKQESK